MKKKQILIISSPLLALGITPIATFFDLPQPVAYAIYSLVTVLWAISFLRAIFNAKWAILLKILLTPLFGILYGVVSIALFHLGTMLVLGFRMEEYPLPAYYIGNMASYIGLLLVFSLIVELFRAWVQRKKS